MDEGMKSLFTKSDAFFNRFLIGKSRGRRLNVWDYFGNHFEMLRAIGSNLFTYEGAGDDELYKQIEKRLFLYGRCGIILRKGELVAVNVSPYDNDIYANPEKYTFNFCNGTNDKKQFQREIGKNGVYAKNTFTAYPTSAIAEQYALMLAHCDASIVAALVNGRMMDVLLATNNRSAEAAQQYAKALYDGDMKIIRDMTEEVEINRSAAKAQTSISDILNAKERILKDIYNTFGINKVAEKRERFVTDEIEADEKMLSFNLKDMLEQRKKMCDDIYDTFRLKIDVKCHVDIDADGRMEGAQELTGPDPDHSQEVKEDE